ncbi:MAG TPA: hypothetical protein VFQ68_14770 [Streptosporangiaceae bacterium]|nr:hypothetical protein [Streptosporangiaceae bacterium]
MASSRRLMPLDGDTLSRSRPPPRGRPRPCGPGSDADWTILRPSGLYELPEVTDYSLTTEHGPGRFTARIDLADAMLRQVTDDRFSRRTGHVITTRHNPRLLSMMLREAFRKQGSGNDQAEPARPPKVAGGQRPDRAGQGRQSPAGGAAGGYSEIGGAGRQPPGPDSRAMTGSRDSTPAAGLPRVPCRTGFTAAQVRG